MSGKVCVCVCLCTCVSVRVSGGEAEAVGLRVNVGRLLLGEQKVLKEDVQLIDGRSGGSGLSSENGLGRVGRVIHYCHGVGWGAVGWGGDVGGGEDGRGRLETNQIHR